MTQDAAEDTTTTNSTKERLALVLVELDDIGESLARARAEIEAMRRAA